jgi:heat shock protein HtpX
MKRVTLFVATNMAVLLVIVVVLNLLGIDQVALSSHGVNYQMLLIFAAALGFGGSFISLALSKWMAIRGTGAQIIKDPSNTNERWLVNTVRRQAEMAGIGMPDVAIFDSPEPNAFATGMSRNSALVAVSTGLLRNMNQDQVEAVLAHEVSHVANGDMITLTLIQGVVNTFVVFFSRLVGYFVDRVILKNEQGYGIGFMVATIAAQLTLGFLASFIVMAFSRRREYRADAGGAALAGRQKMISALQALQTNRGDSILPEEMAAFGILGSKKGFAALRASHPPLEERIKALQSMS